MEHHVDRFDALAIRWDREKQTRVFIVVT